MTSKQQGERLVGPGSRRLSSKAQQAARVAEIADEQSRLKREAAERRAKRDARAATSCGGAASIWRR